MYHPNGLIHGLLYFFSSLGPPIVVHCSAGIGRTGTFATLDIAIRKFSDQGKVDIRSTVERIRGQRAFRYASFGNFPLDSVVFW